MKSWEPNKLVQDDADVAYVPDDKAGRQIAAQLTAYLRLLMWRVKMDRTKPARAWVDHPNCRCIVRPIEPQK